MLETNITRKLQVSANEAIGHRVKQHILQIYDFTVVAALSSTRAQAYTYSPNNLKWEKYSS